MVNEDLEYRTAEATTEAARLELFKQREQGYVATFVDTVPSNGGTVTLHVENPPGSEFYVDVIQFLVTSQFRGEFAVYDQFSSTPSGGSAVSIDNLLMDTDGDNGSTMGGVDVARGVSFSASGSPHFAAVLPTGGQGPNSSGASATATTPLIEPGREVVLELTNNSSQAALGSLGVVYLERTDT